MKNRSTIIYLAIYMLLGTAAVAVVQGQSPVIDRAERGNNSRANASNRQAANEDSLDVVVPRGRPSAISDWALAGVVWSDACLVRKLTRAGAEAAEDNELAARYMAISQRSERLISALEEFGWRRIASSAQGGPERPPVSRRPRQVGGTTLVPVEGPIELDLYQRNFRLEGAGDAEPEILPPQVEKGMEEAIADTGVLRSAEFDDGDGRISYRESQTRSDTMPYSYESIYDTDDYDPDVDYRNERPMVIADPVPPEERVRAKARRSDDQSDDVADMYGFEDREQRSDGNAELNPVPVEPSNLLDSLVKVPQVKSYKSYTEQGSRHEQDSNWVQLHLNLNQRMWQSVAETGDLPSAIEFAQAKLANTAELAESVTGNLRLRAILQNVD